MSQVFTDEGRVVPVTVIAATPAVVSQVRTERRDGYAAVQLATGDTKESRVSRALAGHLKKAGAGAKTVIREFRPRFQNESVEHFTEGATVDLSQFSPGDTVHVSAISKGKGFQGVVKRHGFGGGPRTHGQKHSEREPGAIGATGPQRVMKGTKMAGRMGGDRVTVRNLEVVSVDADAGELLVKGAVPGRRGTRVEVRGW